MSEVLKQLYGEGLVAPKLDYYYGRPVKSCEVDDEGLRIVLDGDVVIRSPDASIMIHDQLAGFAFATAIFSKEHTRLVFVKGWNAAKNTHNETSYIVLNPLHYSISDQNFNDGDAVYPQRDAS
jgi:hypothetical protein